LFNYFKEVILEERQIESVKETLSQRPDWNLYDAFRTFDSNGKGAIHFF